MSKSLLTRVFLMMTGLWIYQRDAKLLWVYFITKCDHAGILKLNVKLCKVQTDIKDLSAIIKELGNRLVTVVVNTYILFRNSLSFNILAFLIQK